MSTTTKQGLTLLLRKSGYKVTHGRLTILQVLAKADHPLSIAEIMKNLGSHINQATLYRALEALTAVNIVRRVDLHHPHAHYELVEGGSHHHHLICTQCGYIEDVLDCDAKDIEKTVLKRSTSFTLIEKHSLEFFGYCKKCATAKMQAG
jgi:Fe2+ or Zn2+ uptake regulation protein